MPNAVDTRVIQMQFDNRDFERNIKTSDKSLSKFKENLDFNKCERSLSDFARATKALTFDNLVNNVQKLTDKFTGLGTVSEYILSKIRYGIESTANKIGRFVDSLGFEQITQGLDKYGQMNKNVQTIMAATGRSQEDVYSNLERLNRYTDQTSYNFTEMAANIGKFTSVGIPLEQAEKQMEGIANWAARSGAGINEASRAMYNLSQAMGVGSLQKIDWKSIENAGMATKEFKEQLIQAGIQTGNLVVSTDRNGKTVVKTAKKFGKQTEVTYSNLAETLNKKWADKNTLGKTLEGYYRNDLDPDAVIKPVVDLTEDQQKAIQKKFEDFSLNKDDFSYLETQNLATTELKQAAIDAAVKMGTLVKTVDKSGKAIYKTNKVYGKEIEVTLDNIASTLEVGWFDKSVAQQIGLIENLADASYAAAQKCTTLSDVFNAWRDQLSTGWMRAWQLIFGDLSESMELFSTICNKVGDHFSEFIKLLVGGEEDLEDGTTQHVDGILSYWAKIGGRDSLWSMFVGEYDGMYEGAYGILDVIDDIGKMIGDAFWTLLKIMDPKLDSLSNEKWMDNEAYRVQYLGNEFKKAIEKVKGFIQGIKDFLNAVPEGQTKSRFQMITDTITGVFSIFAIVYSIFKDIVGFILKIFGPDMLGPVIDDIIEIFKSFGDELTKTGKAANRGEGLKKFFDDISKILIDSGLIDAIKSFSGAFKRLILTITGANSGQSTTISLWQQLANVLAKVFNFVAKIATPIVNFLTRITNAFKRLVTGQISFETFAMHIKTGFEQMINSIFSFTPNFTGQVKGIFQAIKKVFTSGFSKESIKDLSDKVGALFGDFKKKIPGGVKEAIKSIYTNIKTFVSNIWTKIKAVIDPLIDDIKNVFKSGFSKSSIKQLGRRFKTIFGQLYDKLPDGVKEAFTNISSKISAKLKEIWEKIKAKVMGIFSFGSKDTKQVLDKDGKPVKGAVGSFFDKLKTWFNDFAKDFKESTTNANLFTLIKEALGLGVLGKFIGGLIGLFKSTNVFFLIQNFMGLFALFKLIKLFKSGSGLLGTVQGFFTNLSDTVKNGLHIKMDNETETFGDKLLKIAKAIALIAASIAVLGLIPLKNLVQGMIAFTVILGVILGFMAILKKIAADFKQTMTIIGVLAALGFAVIAISIGVAILLLALKPVAEMKPEGVIKMLTALSGILLILVIFARVVQQEEKGIKVKGVMSIVLLSVAVAILVFSLKSLADLEWGQLGKMGASLFVILAMLVAFTKKVSFIKGAGMFQLILLAGSIWILLEALKPLANYEWGQLAKMGAGLVLLMLTLTAFTNDSASMKRTGMGQLIIVAGAIFLLLEAIKPLANYSWESLGKMGASLVVLLGLIVLFTKTTSGLKIGDIGGVGAISGAIYALVQAALPLANFEWEQLGKMGAGLAAIIAMVIIMTHLIKPAKDVKSGLGSASVMLGLVAVIASFSLLFLVVKDVSWDKIVAACLSIMAVITVYMLLITRLTKIKDMTKAIPMMLMMVALAVVLGAFGLALRSVKNVDPKTILAFAAGLTVLIVGMAAALFILSKVNVATGIVAIGVLVAGIILVMGAIALMIPVVMNAIGSGLESMMAKLALVGGMFADFSRGMGEVSEGELDAAKRKFEKLMDIILITKDAGSYISGINDFETCMLKLGNGVSQFVYSTSDLSDPENNEGLKFIKEILSYKDEFSNFSIGNFNNDVAELGGSLSIFGGSFATEDVEKIQSGIKMIQDLAGQATNLDTLSKLPLDTLKNNIAGLGGALSIYATGATEADGLQEGDVPDIQKAVELMRSVITSLGADGGFELPNIPKDDVLGDFGIDLAALATAMTKFASASQDLGDTSKAIELLDFLGNLKLKLTVASLDPIGAFTGANVTTDALTDFAVNIAVLGIALQKFSDKTKNFSYSQNVKDALTFFADLKTRLTKERLSSVLIFKEAGITSTDVLTEFGNNIGELGEALGKFANNVNFDDEKAEKFSQAINALDRISDIARRLPIIEGVSQWFSGHVQTIGSLAEDIEKVGQGMANFSNALTKDGQSYNSELVESAVGNLLSFSEVISFLSKNLSDDGSTFKVSAVRAAGYIAEFLQAMNTGYSYVNDAGEPVGFDSAVEPLAQMVKEFDDWFDVFDGKDIKNSSAFSAFRDMTEGISALINVDPSLDFGKVGTSISDGIKKGIIGGEDDVKQAVLNLCRSALLAAETDTLDSSPKITPILDLSKISTDAEKLNALLNNPYITMNADGTLAIDPSGVNDYANQAIPTDYTSAIGEVRDGIDNMRSDLRTLAEAMQQMKFVFQTGSVVAAIGPEMDKYLAEQGYYAVRSQIP